MTAQTLAASPSLMTPERTSAATPSVRKPWGYKFALALCVVFTAACMWSAETYAATL